MGTLSSVSLKWLISWPIKSDPILRKKGKGNDTLTPIYLYHTLVCSECVMNICVTFFKR